MILCDTHCDTLMGMAFGRENLDVTPEKMKFGGVTLQTMAMFTGPKGNKGDVDGIVKGELAAFERLKEMGLRAVDDPREVQDGENCMMLSIEGAEPFEKGLQTVSEFRQKGVRMVALTWNNENALAYPAKSGSINGLKPYGLQVVAEMQRLHMAVDTSHLNRAGFFDLFYKTNVPPMASHSCVDRLCPHFRNLTDEQLLLIIRNGGYVGVNFYPAFLSTTGKADVNTLVEHIDYICQLGGVKNVGLGSDFDGIDSYPEGVRDCTQTKNVLDGLRKRGYKEEDVAAVAGQNLLDYFGRI